MKIKLWTDKQIMEGAEPIFLPGDKKIGVLLLHGWSSSPQEFNAGYFPSVTKYLNKKGYTVYVPLRLGQGTKPEDLIGLTWEDWVRDALEHYDTFSKEVDQIVVGGMSTGANLALQIAKERSVAGVIPMGTTIFTRLYPIFLLLMLFQRKSNRMKKKTYFPADRKVAMRKVHYFEYPISSLYQNLRASWASKKVLKEIKVPALIMHSKNDHVIHPRSGKYIYKHIGSQDKELIWIEDSYHSFTTDQRADKAAKIMTEFIDRITSE